LFRKTSECDKTLKSNPPIRWCLHAFADPTAVNSETTCDLSFGFGVPASRNRITERFRDRHEIEGGSQAGYSDAGNSHGIEDGKTSGLPVLIIVLVGGNRFGDDLWFVCEIKDWLALSQNEQDHRLSIEQTKTCFHRTEIIATDRQWDDEA
jgi:hypothetical protein